MARLGLQASMESAQHRLLALALQSLQVPKQADSTCPPESAANQRVTG
jgi:hypothetical protein